jgi:RNA polymerase sigma-70 factor (ECF subfamily)
METRTIDRYELSDAEVITKGYTPFAIKLKRQELELRSNILQDFKNSGNLATKKVYDALRPLGISYAFKLCGDWELSREIADDAFVSLWRNREKIEDWKHAGCYLSKSIMSRFCDRIRAEKKIRIRLMNYFNDVIGAENAYNNSEFETKLTRAEKEIIYKAQVEWLSKSIFDLPDRIRKAFIMKYIMHMNTKDIRSKMELSRTQIVTNYTSKAMRMLMEKVERDGIKAESI